MRSSNGARPGAFLSQAPRRKGVASTAIALYGGHSGFRFLSNFVFFGGLTLACLALSSNLGPQPGGSMFGAAPSFNLGGLAPQAGAKGAAVADPTGPVAPSADPAAAPSGGKAPLLAQALDAQGDGPPAAPILADYKVNPTALAGEPADVRTAVADGLAAIKRGGADIETGLVLLRRAADAGSATGEALYGLARMAPPGGLPADASAGRQWLQKAAQAGDAQAARILAQAYLTGSAGYSDVEKAKALYGRAHDLGDARSSLALASLLARGADPGQAEQVVRVAADRGDRRAMTVLGRYLTLVAAKGLSSSYDEADLWLTRAADQGDVAAMEQLGDIHMFLAKSAPAQDPAKGFGWYRRCADAGSAACHFAVGRAYSLALGTSGDLARAWAHLTVARDRGQPKAGAELDSLEPRLTQAQRADGLRILAELKNSAIRPPA